MQLSRAKIKFINIEALCWKWTKISGNNESYLVAIKININFSKLQLATPARRTLKSNEGSDDLMLRIKEAAEQ